MNEAPKRIGFAAQSKTFKLFWLCVFVMGAACVVYWSVNRPARAEKAVDARIAPEALSASFAEIARRVEPAVVNIDTKTNAEIVAADNKAEKKPPANKTDDEDETGLERFRRQLPSRPSYSIGSGFIVDPRGYILTNYHVIEDTNRITIKLQSNQEFIAAIVGVDEPTDLAVLKINAGRELPSVKLGDSAAMAVGDWVLAVGSPFGLDQTVTAGIISKVERETPSSGFQKFIQTDAAINRGNSGGPLVNMNGEVIGVNSQIATTTGDYNGIGFALPSNEASRIYNLILQNGRVQRGYLGVALDSVKPEFAKIYNLAEAKGAIVTNIPDESGAAARAGLRENDVITKFNDAQITDAQDLRSRIAATAPNQSVKLVYLRETGDKLEERTAVVTLGERPTIRDGKILKPRTEAKPEDKNAPQLGLTVTELTASLAVTNKLTGQKGAFIKDIDPNGIIADVRTAAGDSAVGRNDLITRFNRQPINSVADFNQAAKTLKTGDAVVLHVVRYDAASKKIVTRIVQFTFQ